MTEPEIRPSAEYYLERIERVRARNNEVWMQLIRLAVRYAPPVEVAGVFHDIEINDRKVSQDLECLRKALLSP